MSKRLEKSYSRGAKKRLYLVFGVAALFWTVLVSRLFQIQVLQAERFQAWAENQNFWQATQKAPRGVIFDRRGTKLAYDVTAQSFFAVPDSVTQAGQVAAKFSTCFGKPFASLQTALTSDRDFIWLERLVDVPQAKLVEAWKLKGVYSREESKRAHPLGDLGLGLLGLTDVDNQGIAGLELHYDSLLSGQDGRETLQKDARGQVYHIRESPWDKPRPGYDLVLTLDAELQWILENRLREGLTKTKANSGFGILLDSGSGEVLALATRRNPKFNSSDERDRLRALTDQFEPGSTIKIVTAASALEEKIKSPQDRIYAEKGKWKTGVGGHVIHDIHEYDTLTFQEAVGFSSNVALAKVGLEVGREKLYKYLRNFGFGFQTGIDLPGEAVGQVQPLEDWNKLTLISNSIGYGLSVTALQLVCAYAAVANDGLLMKPHLVKAVLDGEGNSLKEFNPVPVRQVISPETARLLTEFLKLTVEEGTGTSAKLEGVEIGGKTGTARKAKIGSPGYEDEYLSSFVGFFPVDHPRYVGIIVLDSPQGPHYGGQTAAPIFRNVVADILSLPSTPTHQLVKQEELVGKDVSEAQVVAVKLDGKVHKESKSDHAGGNW